jgi:hypothetical protein
MPLLTGGTLMENTGYDAIRFSAKTPALGTAAAVLAAQTLPTSGTTTVSTGLTQPDYARNATITGNAAGINGSVVINGTNLEGSPISETIVASGTATVVGNKAFASFTSIVLPARTTAGDTISIGLGSKLGLPVRLPHNTVLFGFVNNVKEGTAPTVATSASLLESNTISFSTALSGVQVDAYMFAG